MLSPYYFRRCVVAFTMGNNVWTITSKFECGYILCSSTVRWTVTEHEHQIRTVIAPDGKWNYINTVHIIDLYCRLPPEYYLKKLDDEHIVEALKQWVASYGEDRETFVRTIKKLPSVGIFRKELNSDQSKEEMMCHSILKLSSDIGLTFTKEQYRRQGLAKIATLHLAHELMHEDCSIHVSIRPTSYSSIKMHENLGFNYYTSNSMMICFPKDYKLTEHPEFALFDA